MADVSLRSKFYIYNSMVCLLKALEGKCVTVEIRNDIVIEGQLDLVETTMNLVMSDVVLTNARGRMSSFPRFYVKGRQIRFVKIPDDVDIIRAMKWEVNKDEYFKEKEKQNRDKMFQKRQVMRAKKAAKLNKDVNKLRGSDDRA